MPYRHVLVVCDGSSEGYAAVQAASQLAIRERADLTVAAVAELEHPGRCSSFGAGAWNDVLIDAAGADLDRARGVVEGPARFTVLTGPMTRALADAERQLGCDLIVLPRSGRGLGRIFRRDHSRAVGRRTGCQVMPLP
jgi:nucleotide-binding universal stress UspA family protein